MVQLKSFKVIEPPEVAATGPTTGAGPAVAAEAGRRQQPVNSVSEPVTLSGTSARNESDKGETATGWSFPERAGIQSAGKSTGAPAESVTTGSASSSGASSPATLLRRALGGGGNLTSSDSSNRSSAHSHATTSERARTRRERTPAQLADKGQEQQARDQRREQQQQQQHQLAQVVAVSGVVGDEEEEEGSELTTLSSNEEYQVARVEMGEEETEGPAKEESSTARVYAHETRASTGGPESASASRSASESTQPTSTTPTAATATTITTGVRETSTNMTAQQQQKQHQQQQHQQQKLPESATQGTPRTTRPQPIKPIRLPGAQMSRSHTSPSPLDRMVPLVRQASRGLERGKLTGPPPLSPRQAREPPLSPPLSPAARSLGGGSHRFQPDNMSQHSFAQAKYAGSKHFEIRWQNVRLFTRPKSRLPSFISDNLIYRSVFGGAGADADPLSATGSAAFEPLKPPYSPPLNHHKIPPTIDEHLEMKCPHSAAATGAVAPGVGPTATAAATATATATAQAGDNLSRDSQRGGPQTGARVILNNISGQVFSGQMTAVLGPSGVGKTSLLNSLTGRNTLDGTGRVSLIGAQESKRLSVVTVPQVDVLPGKLTAREDLEFTSRLKNPQARFDHARNIDRLVRHLHMDKFLNTRIDKLSGGEARRLSIARELLSSPDIMILDEPTSGLDANTCKKIITALRDIVEHSDNILDKPMSIIITIHQPQQEVYQLFHRVYVMAQGGRVVYEGSPQMLLPTLLEQSSLTRVCPPGELNENPAIVAIEVASGEFGDQVIEELAIYHEGQVYEEFSAFGVGPNAAGASFDSPMMTPRSLGRLPHKSPLVPLVHRKRLNSFDSSLGKPTPQLARRGNFGGAAAAATEPLGGSPQPQQPLPLPLGPAKVAPGLDRMSSMTSLSYASTYDEYLPEVTSRLKVDKRLRRSVVIKSHFVSHTLTLVRRCWLLTRRDLFLMAIRILGFLLVAAGTVQIFSGALDPLEHQCPQFESEVDDMAAYINSVRDRLAGLLGILRQANSVHLFFFHILLCITMVTSALTGLVFPLQMRMFVREYKNGWYSPASFIMSQTIAELPADTIGPLLCLLITYPLCHQPDSLYHWRLVGYTLVMIMTSIICKSQAQIVGAFLMDSVENSVFISCVCVTGPALLSGIPLRVREMSTPLQWASYGSFLRYAFESLMELRYGYGMCPCDPELVRGPLHASARAIPPHLENLAVGLLELSGPLEGPPLGNLTANATSASTALAPPLPLPEHENLFLKFLRLTTDASNLFADPAEIQSCSSYRSLYLISIGIAPNTLVFWATVMVCVFVLSRILTYFAVKTVIKLRRN